MKRLAIVFGVLAICFVSSKLKAQDSLRYNMAPDSIERAILVELYNSTGGDSWTNRGNWLQGDMSTWYGILVENGDVVEINLSNNNLSGAAPKSIYQLPAIRSISLSNNNVNAQQKKSARSTTVARSAAPSSSIMQQSSVTQASTPPVRGNHFPVWGLAVRGAKAQRVDWRNNPPSVEDITNSSNSVIAPTGIAIDNCGRIAFYALHTGTVSSNQLHLYTEDGTRLTTVSGLNGIAGQNEMQLLRVPGFADEWYIIYTLFKPIVCHGSIAYCPATVAYSRVKYNVDTKVFSILVRDQVISSATFIQGKAVSRPLASNPLSHYLYLAERKVNYNKTRLHRFTIDATGIRTAGTSAEINAGYWFLTIAASNMELSPDGTRLAITNRNELDNVFEDIILFNLAEFDNPSPAPVIINLRNLIVQPDNNILTEPKSIAELWTTQPRFACLRHFKNKMSAKQFSPSGRYLYLSGGGFPVGIGVGKTYTTYLVQVDLQSGTPGKGDYDARIQIQEGYGVGTGCVGTSIFEAGSKHHSVGDIEVSYDGRLYFTKGNESRLFVIPFPDDPMPQQLVPAQIDLSTPEVPNIKMNSDSYVGILPDNINGFNYVSGGTLPEASLTVDKTVINEYQSVLATAVSFVPGNTYSINWGDGTLSQTLSTNQVSHQFRKAGTFKVVLTATSNTNGCSISAFANVRVDDTCIGLSDLNISYTRYVCAHMFNSKFEKPDDCSVTSYNWSFGDGGTSNKAEPVHVFNTPGKYMVSLTINYRCGSCPPASIDRQFEVQVDNNDLLKDTVINIATDLREKILSTSASTFADVWPLQYHDVSLNDRHGFMSGTQGVWRNEASFVYNVPRRASVPVDLKRDGTFDMEFFNWQFAEFDAIPNWIRTNTMTEYSPFSYELENRDVTGVYSAALYDYGGHLPSANGVNMRNNEMAFTSFEFPSNVVPEQSCGNVNAPSSLKVTGNLIFGTEAVPAYIFKNVHTGYKNIAIVEAKLSDFENVSEVDVVSRSYIPFIFFKMLKNDINVPVVCTQAYPNHPEWTIVVLGERISPGVWKGTLKIKNKIVPVVTPVFDDTYAHSGKSSLKIDSDKTFDQPLLHGDPGKTYVLNAWVSIGDPHIKTPKLSNRIGIDVIMKNKRGSIVSLTSLRPTGPVIEGWQQVKGSLIIPEPDIQLSLKFKAGDAKPAWYDDLRIHPENGNMKSYVYDITNYRLQAVLDEENFATLFFYDQEGNLFLTKKETEDGVKTLTENVSYQVERR